MNFLVSTFERFRRFRPADGSGGSMALVHVDCDVPGTVSTLGLVVTKFSQRTVVALDPSGIDDVSKAHDLAPQLIRLLDTDRPAVLWVDLAQIRQISSECLNQLIRVNCHARSLGIRLVLANLCQPLREVFRITRLDRLFDIVDQT